MVFPPAGAATASVASYAVTTAYGIPLILQTDATLTPILKYLNPFLYRGYVYDIETTLYYLQSRYYDPEMGRFINADGLVTTGQGILGNNMFTYCNNNPVSMADTLGKWPRWITAAVAVASAVVAVAAAATGNVVVATAAAKVAIAATAAYELQCVHYDDREKRNQGVPKTYNEAMSTPGADNTISAACHQFTAEDSANKKVCWPDGKEGIYDSNGNLVTDPRDVGTYNYSVPNGGWSSAKHFVLDIAPWAIFGNSDDDPGPLFNVIAKAFD
jgi:RHS repeat-associated protein